VVAISGNVVILRFTHRGRGNTGIIVSGATIFPSGSRGPRGPRGRDNFTPVVEEETVVIVDKKETKRGDDSFTSALNDLKLSNVYVQKLSRKRDSVASIHQVIDASSTDIQFVTKKCPPGKKVLFGNCKWDVFRSTSNQNWCKSKDFLQGPKDCKNCISYVDSAPLEGEDYHVVTKMSVRDETGVEKAFDLNENSCTVLETSEIDSAGLRECGTTCLLHQIDPIYESEDTFSCRYIAPSVFGVSLPFADTVSSALQGKIQSITVEITCIDK